MFLATLLASLAAHPARPTSDAAPLYDPTRPVTFVSRDSFTLQYATAASCATRIQVRESGTPMAAWKGTGATSDPWTGSSVRVVQGPSGERRFHTITVGGLLPGRRYYYRVFDGAAQPSPEDVRWGARRPWRREYAVATLAGPGKKTVVHLPIKVLVMPNVLNLETAHGPDGPIAPLPPRLSGPESQRLRDEFNQAARFFWVNSGMRLWLDFRLHFDDRWQRWGPEPANAGPDFKGWPVCRSWDGVDYRDPGGGGFTVLDTRDVLRVSKDPVVEEVPFAGQIELAMPRRWRPEVGRWELYDSGGGTYGIDGFPDGFPARSQFLGGGDIAWLVAHEVHHQLESMGAFSLAQREDDRIVFNHYSPRRRGDGKEDSGQAWSTSGRHGEHWDGMAYWDRSLSGLQWLRLMFGAAIEVIDADEDGFPDSDPRLPLDEARFGSRPDRAMTDGRLNDLAKAMLSTWAPGPLQSTWIKPPSQAIRPKASDPDSDGDGLNDDIDPEPLLPYRPFVYPIAAVVDGDPREWEAVPFAGRMNKGGMRLTFRQGHNAEAYYGALTIDGPWRRVNAIFDGEGDGVYSGSGVQGFDWTPEGIRPTFVPAPGLRWKSVRRADGVHILEWSFPNRGEGLWFWDGGGREVGVSITVYDATGRGWSVYEPYRLFYARML
jgi:hypothetical protein